MINAIKTDLASVENVWELLHLLNSFGLTHAVCDTDIYITGDYNVAPTDGDCSRALCGGSALLLYRLRIP